MTKLVQYYIFNATDGHFEQVPVQCNDSFLWKTRSPASIHRSNMDSWKWHIIFPKYRIKLIHRLLKYFATHLIQITVNKTLFLFLIFCVFYGKIEINAIGTYIVFFSLLYPQTQTAPQNGKAFPTDVMSRLRCILLEFPKMLLCLCNVTAVSFHELRNNAFRNIFRSRNMFPLQNLARFSIIRKSFINLLSNVESALGGE